jgi:hypothetical protein
MRFIFTLKLTDPIINFFLLIFYGCNFRCGQIQFIIFHINRLLGVYMNDTTRMKKIDNII